MKKTALLNGKIRTPEGYVQAMLVEGQTIALLGTNGEVAGAGGGAEKIDLGGRLCLPGFIDGHMHFIAYALSLEQIGLNGCRSVHEVRSRLKMFLDQEKPSPGSWIVGRGWNHELFDDGRIFVREDIDGLAPDNPVILTRVCGHVAVLNSRALEALAISPDTRFPGGVVDLDEKGVPTGVVRETVVEWVHSRRPLPGPDKLMGLVARAGKRASEAGLASVHSDDLGSVGGDWHRIIDLYMGLDREGTMPLRVTEQLLLRNREVLDAFLASGWRTGDGSPFFHIGPLKILTDGSMGGRTAFLKEAYSDMPGEFGVPIYRAEELDGLAAAAHRAGMQIAMHAIGDGALDMCLDALEKAMGGKDRDARHYIVHCQMGCMEQYRRMARLGIGAAIQPPFVPSDRPMALRRIGERRALSGYAWKTLKDLGVFLSGGSDCPVEPFDPLWGIQAAVTRQDRNGFPPGGWNPSQKLSVEEAVALYTAGGAYASFEEHRKGSLETGKYADLAVLDRDIFTISPEEIGDVRVCLTMAGGRITAGSI